MSDDQRNSSEPGGGLPTFPEWHNRVPPILFGVVGPLATVLVIAGVWYFFSPRFTDVGYMPKQPVAYSHKLHAGEMGMDCRYCHVGVERGAEAGVPPVQVCMNCHATVRVDSPEIQKLKKAYDSGEPIKWVRVHKTPDYAYFDHSAHIAAAVGCEECHGRIDDMVEVHQVQPLNMQWCLDCHKQPETRLRPREYVTRMGFDSQAELSENQLALGQRLRQENNIYPPLHCSGCHR